MAVIEIRSWCLLDLKRLPKGWERQRLPIPCQSLRMDEELKGLQEGYRLEKGCDGGNEGLREEVRV